MEIHPLFLPLDVRPMAPRPGTAARPVQQRPAPAEQVLHGELLEKRRANTRDTGPRPDTAHVRGSRRDDHPAFQRHFANDAFVQRQALQAYQGNSTVQRHATAQRSNVDYFI